MLGGMSYLRNRNNSKKLAEQAQKEVKCMNDCGDVVKKNSKIKISNLESALKIANALEERSEQRFQDAIIRNRMLMNELEVLRQGRLDPNLSDAHESPVLMARRAPINNAGGEEAEVVGVVDTGGI